MRVTEFYAFEDEIWFRQQNGVTERLTEKSRDVIREMINTIESSYPKAYKALCKEYEKFPLVDIPYMQFRIVNRFCKCNFGGIDNIPDVDAHDNFNFERVPCPMRGECHLENKVCNPEFDSRLSAGQLRVLELLFRRYDYPSIADKLCLSEHTCRNHVRNAFSTLGIHEKAEFIDYAHKNKLFKDDI